MTTVYNAITTANNIALIRPATHQGYKPTDWRTGQSGPAWLFHTEGENKMELTSDITDHYVEDNTARHDHATRKPEKYTVHGFIGEVNNVPPTEIGAAAQIVSRLPLISGMSPQLSVTAQKAYSDALQKYQTATAAATAAANVVSSLEGNGTLSKQQVAFNFIYSYFINLSLWTVQTPWAVFDSMMIESMIPVQSEASDSLTDFGIVFKKVRFVEGAFSAPNVYDGRLQQQSSAIRNFQTQAPASTSNTIASVFGWT